MYINSYPQENKPWNKNSLLLHTPLVTVSKAAPAGKTFFFQDDQYRRSYIHNIILRPNPSCRNMGCKEKGRRQRLRRRSHVGGTQHRSFCWYIHHDRYIIKRKSQR